MKKSVMISVLMLFAAGYNLSLMAGVTMVVDGNQPVSGILASNVYNASYTTIFDQSAKKQGRGQIITIPAVTNAMLVSRLSIQKSGSMTFTGDSFLTFEFFEWMPALQFDQSFMWSRGDGTADTNILNNTSVWNIPVSRTDIPLTGTIAGNNWMHLDFDPPVRVESSRVYAFFINYFHGAGDGETFLLKVGNAGDGTLYPDGALLTSTETANGINTAQDLTFYLQGTYIDRPAGLTIDFNEPSGESVILSNPGTNSFTQLFTDTYSNSCMCIGGRGQTLKLGGTDTSLWKVDSITLQKYGTQTIADVAKLHMGVYEWEPADNGNDGTLWLTGDGQLFDYDAFDGTSITNVVFEKTEFDISGVVSNDCFLHFNFTEPIELTGQKTYLIWFELDAKVNGTVKTTAFGLRLPLNSSTYSDGALMRTSADASGSMNQMYSGQDLTFYIEGKKIQNGSMILVQ